MSAVRLSDWGMEGLQRSLHLMAAAADKAAAQIVMAFSRFTPLLTEAANEEAYVSGLEGRYYVRGGMGCTTELELYALTRQLLNDPAAAAPADEAVLMGLLSPANRARLAAKSIEGYVRHNTGTLGNNLPWHRLIGQKAVIVR